MAQRCSLASRLLVYVNAFPHLRSILDDLGGPAWNAARCRGSGFMWLHMPSAPLGQNCSSENRWERVSGGAVLPAPFRAIHRHLDLTATEHRTWKQTQKPRSRCVNVGTWRARRHALGRPSCGSGISMAP